MTGKLTVPSISIRGETDVLIITPETDRITFDPMKISGEKTVINLCTYGGRLDIYAITTQTKNLVPLVANSWDIGTYEKGYRNLYVDTSPIVGSDQRIKKDISSLEISLITKLLMSILAVQYRLIDGESGRFHYGFLAQDVESALTEAELTSMDFAGFIKSSALDEDGNETEDYIYALRLEEFIPILWAHQQDVERRLQAAGL